jgi:hypothetical protein
MKSRLLIIGHQATVTLNIGTQDSAKFTFGRFFFHGFNAFRRVNKTESQKVNRA